MSEVHNEKSLILVDVHGVVADFVGGAERLFGQHAPYEKYRWDFWEQWPDPPTADEFWAEVRSAGHQFWSTLEVISAGAALVEHLNSIGANWAFCTSAVSHPGSYGGTADFCSKVHPGFRLIGTTHKYELARGDRLLIDDYSKNITDFREAGGQVRTWPQPWNVASLLEETEIPHWRREGRYW